MTTPRRQRRGRAIAMSPEEVDAFLRTTRTCRVATVSATGRPHVAPLWFVWDGAALWLNSVVRSQRWTDLALDSRCAIVVDAGEDFFELRGVELSGRAEQIGSAPRTGEPDPELVEPEELFARKYSASGRMTHDGRHGWLRLVPEKVTSWDFRKVAAPTT
ncbi:MAG: pyridoxamine 5'-phosphate oxidase family protein [Nocardioides sp.]|uniref:pyridoxamine 5'-phosphate oxidase family protein n=1 Tax=Nocardioides sp. TaxID=35761 RepID=UPI0039E3241E